MKFEKWTRLSTYLSRPCKIKKLLKSKLPWMKPLLEIFQQFSFLFSSFWRKLRIGRVIGTQFKLANFGKQNRHSSSELVDKIARAKSSMHQFLGQYIEIRQSCVDPTLTWKLIFSIRLSRKFCRLSGFIVFSFLKPDIQCPSILPDYPAGYQIII